MRLSLVFSLLLAVLAVVFALQNLQVIEVNLLFVRTEGSAALILILTFALGVVVGLLSTLPGRIRDKRTLRKMKKQSSSPDSLSSSSGTTSQAQSSVSSK